MRSRVGGNRGWLTPSNLPSPSLRRFDVIPLKARTRLGVEAGRCVGAKSPSADPPSTGIVVGCLEPFSRWLEQRRLLPSPSPPFRCDPAEGVDRFGVEAEDASARSRLGM